MRNPLRKRVDAAEAERASGPARVDSRTKRLAKRLCPGDIAVIDHSDLDRVAAESLVERQVAAVLNAAPSVSGRYPNLGPGILMEAGIVLVDDLGPDVMLVKEGQHLRVEGDQVLALKDGKLLAEGVRQSTRSVEAAMEEARQGLSVQLEAFTTNTMEYMRSERELLLNGAGMPDISTDMSSRHVLVVVRGYSYKEDLKVLKPYIRDFKPVVIGVDGGADAVLELGIKPDMIVGDMDSVSDKALTCGAEVVVHAYRDGQAPGLERVESLGVDHLVFAATGTSEDIAMLMADEAGAELIVAVGTHVTLLEFLDKGRAGMSSTFLTRLKVGSKLVDAKGVSHLYKTRIPGWQLALLALAGLVALWAALASTPAGQTFLGLTGAVWDDLVNFLRGLVGLAPAEPSV